ncbi:MoaD/ThiS family protein [Rheinheimera sp.]|uniref:MoaD/ThiS family protein n=1 Tax=Rheinheimera sp. TaxID=1869214 RepID=UPI002FDDD2E6
MIKILFFGALRERLQCAGLQMPLHTPCAVSELLNQLRQQSALFAGALADDNLLCALNQQLCGTEVLVQPGDEVAFFPPVTGG